MHNLCSFPFINVYFPLLYNVQVCKLVNFDLTQNNKLSQVKIVVLFPFTLQCTSM